MFFKCMQAKCTSLFNIHERCLYIVFPEELPVVVKKRVDIAFRIVVGEVLAQIIVRAKFSTCAPTQMNNEYTDRTLRLRRRGRGLATLYAVHLTYTVPANKRT